MYIKQRMTIMSAILTTLTLGIGGAIGIPSILAIRSSVTDIATAQAKLDERYALRKYMSKAAIDIADKKKRVAPLAGAALQEGGELAFVTDIETAAETSGVTEKLTLETANQVEISPWEREIPVTIAATGVYPNVIAFIDALQRMPYLLDMSTVDLSPNVAPTSGTVSLELHGVVYWLGKSAPDFVRGKIDTAALPPAASGTDSTKPAANKPL